MASTPHLVTADDLLQMGKDAPYEFVDGVLREFNWKGALASVVGAQMAYEIFKYVETKQLGFVTGGKGGYILGRNPDTVVAPSIGFIRDERFPNGLPEGFCPTPPDLAVEVISATDLHRDTTWKQTLYAKAGVPIVWWVDPETRTVTVHRQDQSPEVLDETSTLDGDVLPGLSLAVEDIFAI